jgi:hypothetical protein
MSRRHWLLFLAALLVTIAVAFALTYRPSNCKRSSAMLATSCAPGYELRRPELNR